jgi:hypothetical protein
MIGHDYTTISLYDFMVFTTSHKNVVVINAICDYPPWLHDIFNIQILVFKYNYNLFD